MLQDADFVLPAWLTRRLITVQDYYRMAEAGILSERDRVELIEGQIIEMVPIGSEHAGDVNRLNYLLVTAVGARAVVTVQNPLRLSDISEPEPDFLLLRPRADYYRSGHPNAGDVLLLIEVSDSSLRYDSDVKAALYARHGIAELWILDVKARSVTVHRDPAGSAYASIVTVRDGVLPVAALPGISLAVADIFA